MRVLGIDPGASGGIALLDQGELLWVAPMPVVPMLIGGSKKFRLSPAMFAGIVEDAGRLDEAFIEEVTAMPKQGVSSTFTFGASYGAVLGVLAGMKVPYTTTRPQEWRRIAGVKGDKTASRHRAAELFPYKAGAFARVKDDGVAEAALIAFAGYQKRFD